jgi:CelD/BcsL family acetyltransferase involved in cellulose biosynthesis
MALREIGALRAELVEGADDLEPWRAEWDRLAIAAGRPYCAPAWMLAWWLHVAPPGARLRAVLAVDDRGLAGIAPFFRDRGPGGVARHRLLGIVRAEPLARPGMEAEAARLFATALAGLDGAPDLIRFEGVPADSAWLRHLAEAWPGRRPWLHTDKTDVAPTVVLSPSGFDEWFAGKSRNFRQQMRRARRQLEERGATLGIATSEELPAAVDALARLHRSRWEAKQGGAVLDEKACRMLVQAGRGQPEGRFRLWSIRVEDRIISAHLFIAAGGEVAYWLGGFDEAWAAHHPSLVTILAALEHAWGSGDRRVDLGWGGQRYKYRFAGGEDRLAWWTLVPPGPRSVRTRLAVAPAIAMRAAGSRLPPGLRDRVKRVVVRKRES